MDLNFGAAIIGGVQGQVGRLIKNHFEHKKFKIEAKYDSVEKLRDIKNDRFLSMQAAIGLMITFYVCMAPFILAFTQIPIEVAYMESNGWMKALFSGSENILWYHIEGFPIGPVHTYLASSVVFYFLGSTGR